MRYSPILETSLETDFSSKCFTKMLLSYIFRPSVVKYGVLSNSRRSKLHAVIDCLFSGVVADVTVVISQSTYSLYRVVNRGPFTATRCRNLPWKWRTFWTIVPISCHSTAFPRKLLIACCCCFCVVLAHFPWCLRDFGSTLGNAMVALIAFLESRVRLVKFGPFCWLSTNSSLIQFLFCLYRRLAIVDISGVLSFFDLVCLLDLSKLFIFIVEKYFNFFILIHLIGSQISQSR